LKLRRTTGLLAVLREILFAPVAWIASPDLNNILSYIFEI
jgi:hypothetical protein